jgi:aminomuconate-semialdehyde/2-hydroxymuconate-6-semialdehyde dehydrogenase
MTAHLLTEICRDVGLPPGVLNVVHGLGAKVGAPLVAHPLVRSVSFTGGTKTGADIARTAAPQFKKLTLELGGKNPNVVFADADMEEAVKGSIRSAFDNQGQICLCGSRLFVQREVFEEFLGRFLEATHRLKVGDPLDPATDQGALISQGHLEKVQSYLRLAEEQGGQVLVGGRRPAGLPEKLRGGYFLEPAVVAGLDAGHCFNQEEIFGPVVSVSTFSTEDEAVRLANATPFGLSASLWTRDLARAHRVAEKLDAGTVWVNCWLLRDLRTPFGGVKDSGVGREGGDEAIAFFTDPKTVCIKYPTEG